MIVCAGRTEAQQISFLDSISSEIEKINLIKSEIERINKKKALISYLNQNSFPFAKIDSSTNKIIFGEKIKQIIAKPHDKLTRKILDNKTIQVETLSAFNTEIDKLKKRLTNKGYPFENISTKLIEIENQVLYIYISIEIRNKRIIDEVVIKGYQNLPKRLIKNKINNLIMKNKKVDLIKELKFFEQELPIKLRTEINYLYKKDTTKLFIYADKKLENEFSGILGFSNEDNNFELNGNANLKLQNLINLNEKLRLQYNNTNSDQEIIDLNLGLPFLLNTPIKSETRFHIFNQDSTFSNTTFEQNLNYIVNKKIKLGLLYNSETSNNTINSNEDFNYNGIGLTSQISFDDYGTLSLRMQTGERKTELKKTRSRIKLAYNNTLKFNKLYSTEVNINFAETYADDFFESEVFRIGGIHDLRGFLENSIIATQYSLMKINHNFKLTEELTTLVTTDFGQTRNKLNLNNALYFYSFGFGLSLKQTKSNIRIILANGFSNRQNFDAQDTKIHIVLSSYF